MFPTRKLPVLLLSCALPSFILILLAVSNYQRLNDSYDSAENHYLNPKSDQKSKNFKKADDSSDVKDNHNQVEPEKVREKPVLTAIIESEGSVTDIQEIQAMRLKRLQGFCAEHPELSGESPNSSRDEMLSAHFNKYGNFYSLLPEYNFYECRVAKTGTTMRSFIWWAAFHSGNFIHNYPYYHPFDDPDVKKMKGVEISEIKDVIKRYTGSMFVREPIMKIISAYFNKFCDANRKWKMKKHFNIVTRDTPSLGQVIKKLASNENLPVYKFDDHFTSYFNYCNPCLSNFSFIGRFENLKNDLTYLLYNKTNIHQGLSYTIDKAPISPKFYDCPHTMDSPGAFFDVDINDVKRLIVKHKFEYEAFGYNPSDIIHYVEKRIKMSTRR